MRLFVPIFGCNSFMAILTCKSQSRRIFFCDIWLCMWHFTRAKSVCISQSLAVCYKSFATQNFIIIYFSVLSVFFKIFELWIIKYLEWLLKFMSEPACSRLFETAPTKWTKLCSISQCVKKRFILNLYHLDMINLYMYIDKNVLCNLWSILYLGKSANIAPSFNIKKGLEWQDVFVISCSTLALSVSYN